MKMIVFIVMAMMSQVSFAAFGIDKSKEKAGHWRISERTLFLTAILGGGIGAFLGMKVFHHKTLHKQFAIGIPVIMIVQVILAVFLAVR